MLGGLYLITDEKHDGRLLPRVEAALRGGVRILQYRSKTVPAQAETGRALKALCSRYGVTFLVNDSPQLAVACEADGVHLGQEDMKVAAARKLLGRNKLIGVSTHSVEQALKAEMQGADYVAVGSVYPTGTKSDAVHVGLEMLKKVRMALKVPVVAIGGITGGRVAEVIDAGANAAALVSAVMDDAAPSRAARELSLQFHRRQALPRGRMLTVAGSDSGGGAGIQADIKTATLLGGYASSVITALTAQNTRGVRGVHSPPPGFVAEQLETVLTDIGTDTVKTGMLFSADIVAVVAETIERHDLLAVVDPVMIAKGGSPLLEERAVQVVREVLLPQAFLLTPNLPEAEALTGQPVQSEADMERAARHLQALGARHVLLKGGHLAGEAVDLLLAGDVLHRFAGERFSTRNTHGTGCSYSAAIAILLAQGQPLVTAVEQAKAFIATAIRTAVDLGAGHGPVNHWEGAKTLIRHE